MSIEKLNLEYALYEIEDKNSYTTEEIREYAEYLHECLEDDRESIALDMKDNNKDIRICRISRVIFGSDNGCLELFLEEKKLFEEEVSVVNAFQGYFRSLYELINDDNSNDIYKLLCFSATHYQDNMDYLEDLVGCVESAFLEFTSRRYVGRNTKEAFDSFVRGEISRITSIKPVEKIKEI